MEGGRVRAHADADADTGLKRRPVEPIVTIPTPTPTTAACLARKIIGSSKHELNRNDDESDESDEREDDSDESDDKLDLRCARLGRSETGIRPSQFDPASRLLISCDKSGSAHVWDLASRTVIGQLSQRLGTSGLTVRRMASAPSSSPSSLTASQFLFHTRGKDGTVSIHSLERDDYPLVASFNTRSETYCAAAPCWGDPNLLVMPSAERSTAAVVDMRSPSPVTVIPMKSSHATLMALAMSVDQSGHPILACGMESGCVAFHDFARTPTTMVEYQLSKMDPVLTLDMAPSMVPIISPSTSPCIASTVAVVGLAGTPEEVEQLPDDERGRVCLLKVMHNPKEQSWKVRERARMLTCRVNGHHSGGKPSASVCRLQPHEGRLVAVGGWDYRVRIYDRSNGNPLAILRGHKSSVHTVDWAADADTSGLLASCSDREIHVWQCFASER